MDNITVEKLANLGYMSKTSFNRWFKKELGITPIEYLIDVRIKMAKLIYNYHQENLRKGVFSKCSIVVEALLVQYERKRIGGRYI